MTNDEFVEAYCYKCANRKSFDDICNIVKNINGQPQCVNFQNETDIAKDKE